MRIRSTRATTGHIHTTADLQAGEDITWAIHNMGDSYPGARLAAVQAAPVWLDRTATVAKACRLIEEAADNGAQVIGFPEGFIPGFPDWYHWFMPRSREALGFNKTLFKNAVEVPGEAVDAIGQAARRTRTHVVVGVNERDKGTMGTLYNSQLFFGPDGALMGVHRKLMPTFTERLVHNSGDGSSVRTYPTRFGAIGGLICGENTNSLARFALLAQQERIHVASWPAFILGARNHEAIDIRVKYHALEGRVFVISACGILDDACLDAMGLSETQRTAMPCRGGHSGILGPDGGYIAGPVDDAAQIVYADADFEKVIEGKLSHDLTGHYNRFDVFTLQMRAPTREALQRLGSSGDVTGSASRPATEGLSRSDAD
jgi:aliphatic nitrilase